MSLGWIRRIPLALEIWDEQDVSNICSRILCMNRVGLMARKNGSLMTCSLHDLEKSMNIGLISVYHDFRS